MADKPVVNVMDYGAVKGGVADNYKAFTDAAKAANNSGALFLIPHGSYLINGSGIEIKTDVLCYGEIISPNSLGSKVFVFARNVAPVNVPAAKLSGISGTSTPTTKIAGLKNGKGSDLVLKSTEELIKRMGYPAYTKYDTTRVVSDTGDIFPGLSASYSDLSKLTATLYPEERSINITGLRIKCTGDAKGNPRDAVWVRRSNINFHNLRIYTDSQSIPYGAAVETGEGATNINFYDCVIDWVNNEDGYGISIAYSAMVNIINCHIRNCYHAVTGVFAKNVLIMGGTFHSQIDCHWGNGYTIEGAVINGVIQYSGKDIRIRNNTIYGDSSLAVFQLRLDQPELDGELLIEGNTIISAQEEVRTAFFGWSTSFNFGRTVKNPQKVIIRDNIYYVTEGKTVNGILCSQGTYPQTRIRYIEIAGNILVNKNYFYNTVWKNSKYTTGNYNTRIVMRDQDCNGANNTSGISLVSRDDSPSFDDTWGMDILVDNCRRFAIRVDDSAIFRAVITDSEVLWVGKVMKKPALGEYFFERCRFENSVFDINSTPVNLKDCTFSGAIKAGILDSLIRRATGNRYEAGSTGIPNKLDTIYAEAVASLPPANATQRGRIVRVDGGTGVADAAYICKKAANGNYSWVAL